MVISNFWSVKYFTSPQAQRQVSAYDLPVRHTGAFGDKKSPGNNHSNSGHCDWWYVRYLSSCTE